MYGIQGSLIQTLEKDDFRIKWLNKSATSKNNLQCFTGNIYITCLFICLKVKEHI